MATVIVQKYTTQFSNFTYNNNYSNNFATPVLVVYCLVGFVLTRVIVRLNGFCISMTVNKQTLSLK